MLGIVQCCHLSDILAAVAAEVILVLVEILFVENKLQLGNRWLLWSFDVR